jgi:hypothetical protein
MNWSARGNVLNQYLRNTSIGTTVIKTESKTFSMSFYVDTSDYGNRRQNFITHLSKERARNTVQFCFRKPKNMFILGTPRAMQLANNHI